MCDCRPGQLGDTGIIVLQECGPLKKKGCECDDKEKEDERPKVGIRHQQYSLPHKQIKKNICIQASSSSSSASPARSNSFQPRTLVRPSRRGGVSALARPALASPAPAPAVASQPAAAALPQSPVQIKTNISPIKAAAQPTIIRMSSPSSPMSAGSTIALPAGVRPGTNIVRVRAPGPATGQPGQPAQLAGGQQIKVVGAAGQTHIIKSAASAGNMSGIAALAAAAAQQGKIGTSVAGGQVVAGAGQTPIKVVQGSAGQQIVQGAGGAVRMVASQPGASTAVIGGQTVRLASPSATVLKPGTAITGPGGKQIILKQAGAGAGGQPQIVQLVKTSQGMQVATVPKPGGGQPVQVASQGQRIVQAAPGKTIPQGATIVKLVNAQGQPGELSLTNYL